MLEKNEKVKMDIEKVLGYKYCLAYVWDRFKNKHEFHACHELYCCIFCPKRDDCVKLSCDATIPHRMCYRDQGTLMYAMRTWKWMWRNRDAVGYGKDGYGDFHFGYCYFSRLLGL